VFNKEPLFHDFSQAGLLKAQNFLNFLFRHTCWSKGNQMSDLFWSLGSEDSFEYIFMYEFESDFNLWRFNNIDLRSKMSIYFVYQLSSFSCCCLASATFCISISCRLSFSYLHWSSTTIPCLGTQGF